MAFEIGRGVLQLGVDTTALDKGLAQVAPKVTAFGAQLQKQFPRTTFSGTTAGLADVTSGLGGASGALGRLTGLLGAAAPLLAAGTFVGLAKSAVDAAGEINDLSERLGVTTTEVQRLKFAAEQTGAGIDDVAGAMDKLAKGVVEGSTGTSEALDRIGLKVQDLRGLDPAQMFETVAEGIKAIQNPTERAATAMELFGRSGTQLLPAITEGVKKLGDEAERTGQVMSEKTVKAGDDLGDAFGKMLGAGKNLIAGVLAPIAPLLTSIATGIANVSGWLASLGQKLGEITGASWERTLNYWAVGLEAVGLKAEEALPKVDALEAEGSRLMAGMAANAKPPDDALKHLDETYKTLDDQLKTSQKGFDDAAAAMKKQEQAANDLNEAERKRLDTLDSIGATTTDVMVNALAPYIEKLNLAASEGAIPLQQALFSLNDEIQKLRERALEAGADVNILDDIMNTFRQTAGLTEGALEALMSAIPTRPLTDVLGPMQDYNAESEIATTKTGLLTEAFKTLGITSRAELQQIADKAYQAYQVISQQLGKTSPEAIEAFKKWKEAAAAAAGETKKSWADVFPSVVGTVKNIGTALAGEFSSMLLHAKSFKEGFVDIWKDLKAGVLDIVAELIQSIEQMFFKGLLGWLTGQQGAFSKAFGGLLSGGLGSLLGGGTAFAGVPGTMVPGGAAGTWAGTGQAGGIGAGLSGILGGIGAGGAGIGLGFLFKNLFGGAGAGAGLAGGASGAATGALIGSIVPGLGTAIGALIGGLGGLISGWFGKSKGMKANDARDQFLEQYGAAHGGYKPGGDVGSTYNDLAGKLTEITGEGGGGHLFKELQDADTVEKVAVAVQHITAAITEYEQKTKDAAATTDASVKAQADAYDELKVSIKAKMDDIGKQLEDLNRSEAPEKHMGVIERQTREHLAEQQKALENQLAEAQKAAEDALKTVGDASADTGDQIGIDLRDPFFEAERAARGFGDFLRDYKFPAIHVPVRLDDSGLPAGFIPELPVVPMESGGFAECVVAAFQRVERVAVSFVAPGAPLRAVTA